jgi:uncharacterized protein (TIGR02145 family)
MVQDLKFGNKCNKIIFSGSYGSNQTGKVTSLTDKTYYGDCRNNTQSGAGYLYDWAAAINKAGAYYGNTSQMGCNGIGSGTSGTNPGACQGICPVGWHIPTGDSNGEFRDAYTKFQATYGCSNDGCWNASSPWEGVLGGACQSHGLMVWQGSSAAYWSSSMVPYNEVYYLAYSAGSMQISYYNDKYDGFSARCVRNY